MQNRRGVIRYGANVHLVDFIEGTALKTRVDMRGANDTAHKYVGLALCEHVGIEDKRNKRKVRN